MRQLILRSSLLVLAIALSCAIALYALPTNQSSYIAAAIDKNEHIRSARSPKIVFIGGSAVAFGVESRQLSLRYRRDVVNMGLHAGLGLRYMLHEAEPYIHKDDVVVISPEYAQFYGLLDGDQNLLDLLAVDPHAIRYVSSPGQYLTLMRSFSAHLRDRIRLVYMSKERRDALRGRVYFRTAFDRYGDLESQVGRNGTDFTNMELIADTSRSAFDKTAIRELNQFHRLAVRRGAESVLILPDVPELQYRRQLSAVDYAYDRLRRKSEMPVMGDPHSLLMPITNFFDTPYHQNEQGRRMRTTRLIAVLDSVFQGQRFHGETSLP